MDYYKFFRRNLGAIQRGCNIRKIVFIVLSVFALLSFAFGCGSGGGGNPATNTIPIQTAKWISVGPGGGSITSIAIDPVNSSTIYAGTGYGGGVFKSIDKGTSWMAINSGLINVEDISISYIVIDPLTPTTLYVGTGSGILFKSTNSGASWTKLTDLDNLGVHSLLIDPVTPKILYGRNGQGVAVKSNNGGTSWKTIDVGLANYFVSSIVIDTMDTTTLYAGTTNGVVFKTTNSGISWSAISSINTNSGLDITMDTVTHTLYAWTGNNVYKSLDAGKTWSAIFPGVVNIDYIHCFAIDPTNPAILYVGTNDGIYKTTDGGTSWLNSKLDFIGKSVFSLAIDYTDSNTIYAGTWYGGGVYKSTNGGISWSPINKGLNNTAVSSIATSSSKLYVGTKFGIFRSLNDGTSWTMTYGLTGPVSIDPVNPTTVYAIGIGTDGFRLLYKSIDDGISWSGGNNTGVEDADIKSILIDPLIPSTLYVAGGGVFKSNNGGESFLNLGLEGILTLIIDPRTPSILYAGTTNGVIFKTIDGGKLWSGTQLTNSTICSIVLDPLSPNTLYAGTGCTGGSGGVFKSKDGGITWSSSGLNGFGINTLTIDTEIPTTIYAGTRNTGVFKSIDGGLNWSAIGLSDEEILFLVVESDNKTLFAGTHTHGVFALSLRNIQ